MVLLSSGLPKPTKGFGLLQSSTGQFLRSSSFPPPPNETKHKTFFWKRPKAAYPALFFLYGPQSVYNTALERRVLSLTQARSEGGFVRGGGVSAESI